MNPSPTRLHDFPFSGNGYKVRLALAHLGFKVDYQIADILAGETATEQFLSMNPMGQIPVLELSDGTCLLESNAILYWLSENTALMPTSHLARTRVVQWMCFEQSNIDKVLGRARFLRCYPDFRETTEKEFEGWWAEGNRALSILDAQLADQNFLVADTYSAADICLYGYVHCAEEGGFDLRRFKRVSAWLENVRNHTGHITIDQYHRSRD